MATSRQEFVADDLWLLIAIVTFALVSLVGVAGLEALAGAISIVGWFLLTPIFLFWGSEIAAWTVSEGGATGAESGATTGTDAETEADAVEELKRRYAAGEIDDGEFERRLDRLLAVDDALEGVFDEAGPSTETGRPSDGGIERGDRRRTDGERGPETDEAYDRA